jgi:hypothetical protein
MPSPMKPIGDMLKRVVVVVVAVAIRLEKAGIVVLESFKKNELTVKMATVLYDTRQTQRSEKAKEGDRKTKETGGVR